MLSQYRDVLLWLKSADRRQDAFETLRQLTQDPVVEAIIQEQKQTLADMAQCRPASPDKALLFALHKNYARLLEEAASGPDVDADVVFQLRSEAYDMYLRVRLLTRYP